MATSQRRLFANRKNALRSTGPKTPGGKRAASRNAVKHGLSVPPMFEGPLPDRWEIFARRLAEGRADLLPLARMATVARFYLARIQEAIRRLVSEKAEELEALDPGRSADEHEAVATAHLSRQLSLLEDYASRARATWKQCLAQLDQAGAAQSRQTKPTPQS